MKFICFLILLIQISFLPAQKWYENADSLSKKRFLATSGLVATTSIGSILALNSVWYAAYEKQNFHSFDDSKNWMQTDKVGHAYASYHFSELTTKAFRWTGLEANKAAILGTSIGWMYQFSIEMLDGRSSGWGFSWSDVIANSSGNLLYLAQELGLKNQFIKFKFSFFPSEYASYRPTILGSNFSEQLLKDYNAQSYWLSFSPFYYQKNSKWKWLNLALGYSVDGKLVGDEDVFVSENGLTTFYAKREFLLSLDIDVKSLPIKKQWLKTLLSPFNSIKFPLPTLVLKNNQVYGKLWY